MLVSLLQETLEEAVDGVLRLRRDELLLLSSSYVRVCKISHCRFF